MQPRLLLSTQRSGSHFLKSYIATRFSDVVCSGEVLEQPFETQSPVLPSHPEVTRFWTWYIAEAAAGTISAAPNLRIAAFESYLETMLGLTAPKELILDIKYNCIRSLSGYEDTDHGSHDFTQFILSREIPVLHLIRSNFLKSIISLLLARQTGVWHRAEDKAPTEELPKINLDPVAILRNIRNADRLTEDYRDLFRAYPKYDEVIYEDLVHEQDLPHGDASLKAVANFLEKTPNASSPSSIWCKKTTPEDPSEVVENWDEIVRILRNTKYAWMAQTSLSVAA